MQRKYTMKLKQYLLKLRMPTRLSNLLQGPNFMMISAPSWLVHTKSESEAYNSHAWAR